MAGPFTRRSTRPRPWERRDVGKDSRDAATRRTMCRRTQSQHRALCARTIRPHKLRGMTALPEVPRPQAPAPAVVAIGLRLLDRVDDLTVELTEVIRQAEPFYGASGVVPAEDLHASVRDNLVHILSQLSGQPQPGFEPPRATGRRRAEQGVPLPVILHAYRVPGTFIWSAILAEAGQDEVDTSALLQAASELWLIVDDRSGAVTDAYRDAVAERVHSDAQTRNA